MRFLLLVSAMGLSSVAWAAPRRMGFWFAWSLPRVWVAFLLAAIGLALLWSRRATKPVRLAMLGLAFILWGVVPALPLGWFSKGMAIHPSPLCLVGRPIQFLSAGRGIPPFFLGLLAAVALMTVAGSKLFCGWTCPIGAVQELIHAIPLPKGWKTKAPFGLSNGIRVGFFVLFVVLLLWKGLYLYGYVNVFHFLHWDFEPLATWLFVVTAAASLFLFRPFCYHLCPLGLLTWVLEQVALTKVRRTNACTECGLCGQRSPCPAVPAILKGSRIRPDCHACGHCLVSCPPQAFKWR